MRNTDETEASQLRTTLLCVPLFVSINEILTIYRKDESRKRRSTTPRIQVFSVEGDPSLDATKTADGTYTTETFI